MKLKVVGAVFAVAVCCAHGRSIFGANALTTRRFVGEAKSLPAVRFNSPVLTNFVTATSSRLESAGIFIGNICSF